MQSSQQEDHARNGGIFNQQQQVLPEISPPQITAKTSSENQRLLIEAYLKLLDTVAGSPAPTSMLQSITGNRYLVYVHGISQHPQGYSNSWWQALQPHIGRVFEDGNLGETRREVLWSDLVNTLSLMDVVDTTQMEQLRREIGDILEDRQQQEIAAKTGGGRQIYLATQVDVMERGRDMIIDDFLIYMLNREMRQQIINRFTDIVKPLLFGNNQIDIISHSWGTVIAYEGLRELEADQSLQGKVSNFFTVGSALSIAPVRAFLRSANQDGRRPLMVNKWINLNAKGDHVGGMLGHKFDITQENLRLHPTGCELKWFGYKLSCAHSSYFVKENTTVNRDIFAQSILD